MESVSQVITVEEPGKKVSLAGKYLLLGFALYSVSYTISTSDSVNYIACQFLQIIGLFIMVPSSFILLKWRFDSSYLKVLFVTYIFWSLIVVSRGFLFNYQFIKSMLFDSGFGVLLYFAPLMLLFPRNLNYYKTVFTVIILLSVFYIIFDMLFVRELLYMGRNIKSQAIIEYFSLNLSLQAGFLLLTYMYHSKKSILIALGAVALTFLFAAIRARRGLMFMSLSILVFSFFMYYYAHKVKVLVFFISVILLSSLFLIGARVYNNNAQGMFGYITNRIDEQTRAGVEQYFYNDMTTSEWIFGKGIVGEYYCPGIDAGNLTPYRGVIETGYLQIILKGGILSLALLLLIAIPAMVRGIFYSKNYLSKAAGLWILLFLMDLYPATPSTFSMNYLLVWISIGICYSKSIRNASESSVMEILTR